MMYAVIGMNGNYIGHPCITEDEAFELASQQPGRRIYVLSQTNETTISNGILRTWEDESGEVTGIGDWEP